MISLMNSTKHLRTPILLKLFQKKKTKEKEILPNSVYEVSMNLIPETKMLQGNYRSLPPMNIDTKTLNKILTNKIQQHIRRIIYHDPILFLERKDVFILEHQCNTPH